jgi:hypothetical protein
MLIQGFLARAGLAGLLMLGSVPVCHAADPVGHYIAEGVGPDGGHYRGTVDVTKTGETYKVIWEIGPDRFIGTGIGNPDFIAVSYRSGSSTGLALYAARGDDWAGPWVYAGGTQLGNETWTRQ